MTVATVVRLLVPVYLAISVVSIVLGEELTAIWAAVMALVFVEMT